MSNVGTVEEPAIADVDDIKALAAGRLAEVGDRKDIRTAKQTFLLQFIVAGPGAFESLPVETGIFEAHFFINARGGGQDHALLGTEGRSSGELRCGDRMGSGRRRRNGSSRTNGS